jgi:hypothetical protein
MMAFGTQTLADETAFGRFCFSAAPLARLP